MWWTRERGGAEADKARERRKEKRREKREREQSGTRPAGLDPAIEVKRRGS